MGMDLQAFWYKAGKIIKIDQNHISAIIANPESFGMIRDDIEETYKQFNEPIGCEGKAREQIMIEAMKNGWIRIRQRSGKDGITWVIQFADYQRQQRDLKELIEYLLYDTGKMKDSDTVYLNDIDGGFSSSFSDWDGSPISKFVECKKSNVRLVESYSAFK